MKNLKNIDYNDSNLMVYVRLKDEKKFNPLASLKNFTFAPNLMYACLIPFEKLETLKKWANEFKNLCIEKNVTIQIRSAKDRKKVLHQIN